MLEKYVTTHLYEIFKHLQQSKCGTTFYSDLSKVDVPTSNIAIVWTPMFVWYAVRCISNNGHQQDTHLQEIWLRVQNVLTIQGAIVNIIEGDILHMTT